MYVLLLDQVINGGIDTSQSKADLSAARLKKTTVISFEFKLFKGLQFSCFRVWPYIFIVVPGETLLQGKSPHVQVAAEEK